MAENVLTAFALVLIWSLYPGFLWQVSAWQKQPGSLSGAVHGWAARAVDHQARLYTFVEAE